ncbi:MAG TPA: AsmA-like C-terminal region-containing protein [Bacteroidia bacterium]|nr:AsmA-like C-terminal region-containing protein [Bacteroidia bacterium]
MEPGIEDNNNKRSFWSRVFRFLTGLLLLIVLAFFGLVGLLYAYEDDIKDLVIKELNKHLDAEVKVDPANIDLTLLSSFPDCSIEFRDLLMLEALKLKRRDTLLFTKQLNLCFNVKDIWKKQYNIKKIKLKEGLVNLRILQDGTCNYYFWKQDTVQAGEEDLRFRLEDIQGTRLRVRYSDKESDVFLNLRVSQLQLQGNFSSQKYELRTRGACLAEQVKLKHTTYLKDKNCEFNLVFDVNGDDYIFRKATFNINHLALDLSGKIRYADKLEHLAFRFNAPKLDISSVISLMPGEVKGRINDYGSEGEFFIHGDYEYKAKGGYHLKTNFGVKQGVIVYKPNATRADHINLKGSLDMSPRNTSLELNGLKMRLGEDNISGNLLVRNFDEPQIKLETDANLMLENLLRFYPIDTIVQLSGRVRLKAACEGSLKELKSNVLGNTVVLNLEVALQDLKLQFKGDERLSSVENCSVYALDGEVMVRNCKLIRGKSDVTVNGRIPGLFAYISDRTKPLRIEGQLHSDNLYLEDFMTAYISSSDKQAPLIPGNIYFKLDASIGHFSYSKFRADEISGDIEIKNQKAIASDVKLKVMEGEAELNAYFDNSKQKLDVVLQSNLNHINISEMFLQFNNFGQRTLVDQNLKGFATASVDLSGTWSNALEADYNSLRSTCNLVIEQGELIDFKPMLSLSKFVDVNDLQDIRFSKLQSQVEIHDQCIYFPKTSIRSSALNLEFWGKHDFENRIEYHIQLLLSELLSRRRKKKNSEFGEVLNDSENRRSVFVLMTGTVDNPILKYDKSGLREKIRSDIKAENQNLKSLLKEEFGLFKKDTALKNRTKEETRFELEKPQKPSPKKVLGSKKKKEEDDDF